MICKYLPKKYHKVKKKKKKKKKREEKKRGVGRRGRENCVATKIETDKNGDDDNCTKYMLSQYKCVFLNSVRVCFTTTLTGDALRS